jgi:hypothetical protein
MTNRPSSGGLGHRVRFCRSLQKDIDSTIQEANIAYPSDSHLMVKMTLLVNKVWTYMKENLSFFADFIPTVDVKAIKNKARAYWFRDRKNATQTQTAFADLGHEVFTQSCHVKKYFEVLLDYDIERMPWNIRRALDQVNEYGSRYFLHVASFMCRGGDGAGKSAIFSRQSHQLFPQGQARQGAAIRSCLPTRSHWGQLSGGGLGYLAAHGRHGLGAPHDE